MNSARVGTGYNPMVDSKNTHHETSLCDKKNRGSYRFHHKYDRKTISGLRHMIRRPFSLLHHYHYLGNPRLVVEHIRHIAYIDNQVVACLGWASAAWKVRDGIVSSDGMNLPNDALASDSQ